MTDEQLGKSHGQLPDPLGQIKVDEKSTSELSVPYDLGR